MKAMRFARFRRWAPILGAAALWVSLGAAGLTAAEHVVHVGQGGMKFVDETSGTNVSTINAGDTVTWVWEGDMNHGVTAGVCPAGRRGRRGGYVVMPGYGGGDCTPSQHLGSLRSRPPASRTRTRSPPRAPSRTTARCTSAR